MKLELWQFNCECGNKFKSPVLGGQFRYGEFILRGELTGELRYLNALDDVTFSEAKKIANDLDIFNGIKKSKRTDAFQWVVGATYNPDSQGGYIV